MPKFISFTLTSIAAGLAAALLAVKLLNAPDSATAPVQSPPNPVVMPRSGPVSYASAVAATAPSVVNIYTTKVSIKRGKSLFDDPLFRHFFGDRLQTRPRKQTQTSLGSGVIVAEKGFILTNHHVVAEADEINVVLSDGRTLKAELAGTDPDTDLAVIRTRASDLPAITVGDSDRLRVGDVVLAIGNPYGVGQTVTMGIVGATGRSHLGINTFENFIQTDAAINPGNSGGALINAHGELVGINTAIFSRTGGSDGIGFAIPISLAKGVMDQIVNQGRVVRGWLGIAGQDITAELAESFGLSRVEGVVVSAVLEGGPADLAGLEPGDIITRIGEQTPDNSQGVLDIVSALPPGSLVEIRGWRGKRPLRLQAVISERPKIRKQS
jgi:serine protease DegS